MSKAKTISLNISERVNALQILNNFKGNLDKLAVILEDIKQFPITDEEWTKAERVISEVPGEDGQPVSQWTWKDDKGGEKEFTLQEDTIVYLRTTIKDKDAKGEYTLHDKAVITLLTKIL